MQKFRVCLRRVGVISLLAVLSISNVAIISRNIHSYALGVRTIASYANGERSVRGLSSLAWNEALSSSATMKAQDMCAKEYWAHTGPDGATGWTFMSRAGYNYANAGENLAKDFYSDEAVHIGWMASPGHQSNILNPSFKDIGIAAISCLFEGVHTTIVVAHYGATYSAPKAAAKPAPAPEVRPKPVSKPAATPNRHAETGGISDKDKSRELSPGPAETLKINVKTKPGFGIELWNMTLARSHKLLFNL